MRITRQEQNQRLEAHKPVYWCDKIPTPEGWDYKRQYDKYLDAPCGHPLRATSGCRRLALGVPSSFVPMVADVVQEMRAEDVTQDEAVRRLGGNP